MRALQHPHSRSADNLYSPAKVQRTQQSHHGEVSRITPLPLGHRDNGSVCISDSGKQKEQPHQVAPRLHSRLPLPRFTRCLPARAVKVGLSGRDVGKRCTGAGRERLPLLGVRETVAAFLPPRKRRGGITNDSRCSGGATTGSDDISPATPSIEAPMIAVRLFMACSPSPEPPTPPESRPTPPVSMCPCKRDARPFPGVPRHGR
jgi:hypothetical protein